MCSDSDAACPTSVRHQPFLDEARGRIVPEHVAGAVAVEIPDPGDLRGGRMTAGAGACGPLAVLQQPSFDRAGARVVPEHIVSAVIVEIPHARDLGGSIGMSPDIV